MGNKCDKDDRQVSKEEAQNWCKNNGNIPYYETSAIANTNVDEAFFSIIKKAVENQDNNAIEMPDSIGVVGGGNIQLNARQNSQASAYKRKKKCKC